MKNKYSGHLKKAIGYIRVSTDEERQELGLQAQRDALAAWSAESGIRIIEIFEEHVTGGATLDKRPVLLEAIEAVKLHRCATFIVQKIDRFSRDPLTAALAISRLNAYGCTLKFVDGVGGGESPTDELVRGIILQVAKFERAVIAARTRAAMAVKRQRGEWLGGLTPVGWRVGPDGKTLERDPFATPMIEKAMVMRHEEKMPMSEIAKALTLLGYTNRRGNPINIDNVRQMKLDLPLVDKPNAFRGTTPEEVKITRDARLRRQFEEATKREFKAT